MINIPPQETAYLVGNIQDEDFWYVGETQDREQADRVLLENKNKEPKKDWVIIARYTTYEKLV